MNRKNRSIFILILLAQTVFCFFWLWNLRGQQELFFGQEDMQVSRDIWGALDEGADELPTGFYVDQDTGGSVVTPSFYAKRGIYNITVTFSANGPAFPHECISRVVAVDDPYEAQGGLLVESERVDLTEDTTTVSYRADFREATFFRVVNAIDSGEEGRFILINDITVTRLVKKTLLRDMICLLFVMLLLDIPLYLYLFRREKTTAWLERNGMVTGALAGVVLFACFPLIKRGVYFGDDIWYHLRRLFFLAQGIAEGAIPVKIQGWNYGYGCACGVGYGDLFLVPSALLYLAGFSLSFCYDFYIVLMTVCTAGFSYIAFLRVGKGRLAGFTGSVMYTLMGFRLHSVYAGATVGEYGAYTFLPLILLGMWEIYSDESTEKDRRRGGIILAVGAFSLIATHVLSTLLTTMACLLFCLLWIRRTMEKQVLFTILRSLGLIVLMSLWFLVPLIHYLAGGVFEGSWSDGSLWEFAIDPLRLVLIESDVSGIDGGFYALGFVFFAAVFVFFMLLLSGRVKKCGLFDGMIRVFAMMLLNVWMATTWFPSHWFSSHIPLMRTFFATIQFSMHFLDIASVLLCVIAACSIRILQKEIPAQKNADLHAGTALAVAGFFAALTVMQSGAYLCQVVQEGRVLPVMTGRELYSPWPYEFSLKGTNGVEPPVIGVVEMDGGNAQMIGRRGTTITAQVSNSSQSTGQALFPLWAYPGYTAKGDNRVFPLSEAPDHRVLVEIPPDYSGIVTVRFREPWFWRLSEIVSLLTWMIVLAGLFTPSGAKLLSRWRNKS